MSEPPPTRMSGRCLSMLSLGKYGNQASWATVRNLWHLTPGGKGGAYFSVEQHTRAVVCSIVCC
jgi:hypothetical protein